MQHFEKKNTAKKAEGGCLEGTGREVNFIPGCFPENHFGKYLVQQAGELKRREELVERLERERLNKMTKKKKINL